MNRNKLFLVSLALPIVALLFLTLFKAYSLQSGLRFILPISGYDPVDPISGHYVTYRVDYGFDTCLDYKKNAEESCVCLRLGKDVSHYHIPNCEADLLKDCDSFLRGKCKYGRFEAGIEQYFIPEDKAEKIDKIVRKGKSKIKISVTKDGKAIVEDLLLVDD
ncbi:MAG: GDYXXLXY domain-containing protein [Leptospiraceae bacterium]|nr:GDYXXLXY domain-containing protein [Leptospiraceae bacterium]